MRKFTFLLVFWFTITASFAVVKDTYNYPTRGENGRYSLTNNWIVSNVEGNFAANAPGGKRAVSGMATFEENMYFINSELEALVVVDGKTGQMIDTIKITGQLFEGRDALSRFDVKFDNIGHCLIGTYNKNSQMYLVYEVDLKTGAATVFLKEPASEWDDAVDEVALEVYGNVHYNACVMLLNNESLVYRWSITGNIASSCEISGISVQDADYNYIGVGNAPQICPEIGDGFNLFYADGQDIYPTIFAWEYGYSVNWWSMEDLQDLQIENNKGDVVTLEKAASGIQSFRIGDEYFLIVSATGSYSRSPPANTFALLSINENIDVDSIKPLWYFPADGFGSSTTKYVDFTISSVEVNDNVANIYLYSPENGYARYEFKVGDSENIEDGLEDVVLNNQSNIQKHLCNGQLLILRNGKTCSVMGQEM